MPRADAPLQEVLVSQESSVGLGDLQPSGDKWGLGDQLLAALFALVGTTLVGASLVPGWETYRTPGGECTATRSCAYTNGVAYGHRADAVAASWVEDGREGCCGECNRQADCAAATFFDATAAGQSANCIMYGAPLPETIPLEGAALCSLPSDGFSAARDSPLLGATAMLTRFGGFLFAFLLGKALEAVGYGGVGLVGSVLAPRQAGVDAAGIKDARQAAVAAVPEAAGWDAIATGDDAPSTWTEARVALGLSVRQAVWSCGSKLLLWHWAQPLSYFAVLGIYYCALANDDAFDNQRVLGLIVAIREALYVLYTLLALWLNPAYLLLELDSVLKPAAEGEGEGRRVDWQAAKRWGLYLLAPHHYVTACLLRWADGAGRECVEFLVRLVGFLQFFGDFVSAIALFVFLEQPSPPATLAIGYWLTTAGLVAGAGGLGLVFGGDALRGEGNCGEQAFNAVYSLWLGCVALVGAALLVLAPLQLSGAVHGLAP
eukprot:COSAG04_NODE_1607_length_6175_cov_6.046906_3_plen_489_part_00